MVRFFLCFLIAQPAFAHGGRPAAEAIFYDADGLRALHSNFGLLTVVDGVLEWSCAETLSLAPLKAAFAMDGRWFAASFDGVYESGDGGCSWVPASGPLAGLSVVRFRALQGDLMALRRAIWWTYGGLSDGLTESDLVDLQSAI